MAKAGIKTVGDIYAMELHTLEHHFGSYALRLHELSCGIDHNPVVSNRLRKQVSAEDTFPEDIPLSECETAIRRLAEKVWKASKDNARQARTVALKLKTKQFSSLTRSLTPRVPISSCEDLIAIALALRERVGLPQQQLYRPGWCGPGNLTMRTKAAAYRNLLQPAADLRLSWCSLFRKAMRS